MATTIDKTNYAWGALRVIRRSNRYSCVIHPEAFEAIEAMFDDETVDFMDEQGLKWVVIRKGDTLVITNHTPAGGVKSFKTTLSALK